MQTRVPTSIEMAPHSIPPATPKKETKRTSEIAVFSILTAAEQVNIPMMAQMKEMNPSPYFRDGIALALAIFLPYVVLSKYAFIFYLRNFVFGKTVYNLELSNFLLRKKQRRFLSYFSFCEPIITPKTELVNRFFRKKVEFFSIFGFFLEKPLYKTEKT